MAEWSAPIANEFIRLAAADGRRLTQMQIQKLVYISHGWNLAINGEPLTYDNPEAWAYGPVYRDLRNALRAYGRDPVDREITNREYAAGAFDDDPDAAARASLSVNEQKLIERVYKDYGHFHAYKLSALTHQPGTPWSKIYQDGNGQDVEIPGELIKEHFVELAQVR